MIDKFIDAQVLSENENKIFNYRSSLTVFEESLYNGVPVASGYNTSGYPLNVLSNCPTRLNPSDFSQPFCFNVEINGETICRKMELIDFTKEETDRFLHTTAIFKSYVKPIKIYEHTILDGTGMFTRYLEVENLTEQEVNISRLVLHGGGIEKLDLNDVSWLYHADITNIYSYGCFDSDECCREGEFGFHELTPGSVNIDTRFSADRFRHPALFIKNSMNGNIYYIQVGWSGGVRFTVNNNLRKSSDSVFLSYSAEITGYNPLYILAPNEKFKTPDVHFCAVHGNLDKAVNEGIKHFRKSVLNIAEADGNAMLVGAGMGPEHDMSIETSMSFAKQLHDMGAEVFIIDAGWVCPPSEESKWYDFNGINTPNIDRYPKNGFAKLRDYCHSLGMKFAVWMEPERIGKLSGISEKHPDWFAYNLYGIKADGFLDLTNKEAAKWIESEIERIISEFGIDLLRIDYNISGRDAFSFSSHSSNYEECISVRHYTTVYSIFERLKKKYPNVIFENCASGGGRTDLGFLKNFNHTWVSDNQKMPRSVEITNGMTMVLPPERVDRLFAGMGCHTTGDVYSHIRNTMLTHMSLNVISPCCLEPNTEAMEFVKHSVALYKNIIRTIIPKSLIFHHTPDRKTTEEKGYRALEIATEDMKVSVITIFTECFSDSNSFIVYPLGLSSNKSYKVYLDNKRESFLSIGSELIRNGVSVKINSSLSSELIIITENERQ